MQNNRLQKIFFKTFLITMMCIILVAGIGIVAYEVINNLFGDATSEQTTDSVQTKNIITDITLGSPSIELIYDADENDTKISHMVIAVLNTEVHNLDYITVPATTQVTISDELYQELAKISPALPQTLSIGDVTDYFNGEEAYEYGELILGDALGIKIGYFTKIASTEFENYFTEKKESYYQPKKASFDDTLVYSDAFISSFSGVTADTVVNFLTDYSNATISNLTLTNRTNYASDYAQIDYTKIYYWHLYGDYADGGTSFTPNKAANKKLIDGILSNATYTVSQDEYNDMLKKSSTVDSKKLNIQILNGSGIKKQASKWQTKLQGDGYTVGEIGDYSEDNLTSSKIITAKDSTGLDLVKYFKSATIETGTVPEGYDITIVIGSEDELGE